MITLLNDYKYPSEILRKKLFSYLMNLILFGFGFVFAQEPISIELINKKLDQAVENAYLANPENVISILEKIEQESKSIGYEAGVIRVGYISAIIYFNSSDYNKVINLKEEYLTLGNKIKDYENISHIHRLKACAYSELGLLSKGNEEYSIALKFARLINKSDNRQYALSLIYSNLANYHMKLGSPQDSIFVNIKKCIAEAEKIQDSDRSNVSRKYSLISYSHIILANEYEKDGETDLAEEFYLKSLGIQTTKTVPLVERVVLLNQLGNFYYGQKEYDKSVQYAEDGIAMEKKASIPQLRRDLYEVLSKSYMELHETEKSKNYLRLFTALNDSISNINKKAVDAALNKTISQQEELQLNNSNKESIIYGLVGIVLLVFGISFYFYSKKQKQIKKIERVLEQMKNKQNLPEPLKKTIQKSETSKEKEEKGPMMSAEAEEKLVEKLEEFEKKQLFLERKVSLPFVAAEIETNTKYLSYIIKQHKGKDFNEYINDLRINYIVQKITDDPVYRQYKINTLAEEAGFSSHSKFATVFKAAIGVSPSEFIKYFQQNRS